MCPVRTIKLLEPAEIRTPDPLITSQALYQLSYGRAPLSSHHTSNSESACLERRSRQPAVSYLNGTMRCGECYGNGE